MSGNKTFSCSVNCNSFLHLSHDQIIPYSYNYSIALCCNSHCALALEDSQVNNNGQVILKKWVPCLDAQQPQQIESGECLLCVA